METILYAEVARARLVEIEIASRQGHLVREYQEIARRQAQASSAPRRILRNARHALKFRTRTSP